MNAATASSKGRTRDIRLSWLTTTLIFLGWATWLWMLAGPSLKLPSVPEGIGVYDLLWLAFLVNAVLLVAQRKTLPKPRPQLLLALYGIYSGLILLLPLIGLIVLPHAEVSWYMGDLRWIQVASIGAVFILAYRNISWSVFHRHTVTFLLSLSIVNGMVLLAQVHLQVGGGGVPGILEVWYPFEGNQYGRYGFHIDRYAGAMSLASSLAVVGGVLLLTGFLGKSRDWRQYTIALLGLVFVLASGIRSLIFGLSVLIPLIMMASVAVRRRVLRVRPFPVLLGFTGVGAVGWAIYRFNLGRLLTSDRVQKTMEWFAGRSSFNEISGRGGDRWLLPLEESQMWSPFGTLVNPSHALNHLPAFDSYYVVMIAQGGPLLAAAFLCMIGVLGWYGYSIWLRDRSAGAFPLAVVITVLLVSVTQNLMTGLPGRIMITFAVLSVLMFLSSDRPGANFTSGTPDLHEI